MEANVVRARAVVRGRVQMVGFRAFVLRHAEETGLRGVVRNAPDGTVECVIEGPQAEVDAMIAQLHSGPMHARVDRVDVEYQEPAGDLPPMAVRG
jgi:acylphosphatase